MEEFMEHYESLYDEAFTIQNKDIKTSTSYLDACMKLSYDKNRNMFMHSYNKTLYQYLKSIDVSDNVRYINFIYSNRDSKFIISYNYVHKLIIIYMGIHFDEKDLDWISHKIPILDGFKILKNEFTSAFRYHNNRYENLVMDNIIKFISHHPVEFKYLISRYISKSYNFGPRLKMYEKLTALHKNINILEMFNNYIRSYDNKYIITLKYLSPNPDLVFNIGDESILVDIYDRNNDLIRVLELPPFCLMQISEIRVYILEENYVIDFDECYYSILNILTERFFQMKPLNNNSPSSE